VKVTGDAAWIAGAAADGTRFVASIRDAGESGAGVDAVSIWIGGAPFGGNGTMRRRGTSSCTSKAAAASRLSMSSRAAEPRLAAPLDDASQRVTVVFSVALLSARFGSG
jgi:outer membrane receptor for monomeric catechols